MVLWQWSNPLAEELDESPFLDQMEESLMSRVKWCWMVDSVQRTCDKSVILVRNPCLETKVVRSLPHFHPEKEVDSPFPGILLTNFRSSMHWWLPFFCVILIFLEKLGSSKCFRSISFPTLTMMGFWILLKWERKYLHLRLFSSLCWGIVRQKMTSSYILLKGIQYHLFLFNIQYVCHLSGVKLNQLSTFPPQLQ